MVTTTVHGTCIYKYCFSEHISFQTWKSWQLIDKLEKKKCEEGYVIKYRKRKRQSAKFLKVPLRVWAAPAREVRGFGWDLILRLSVFLQHINSVLQDCVYCDLLVLGYLL